MAKQFVLKSRSSEKNDKKNTVKKVFFSILIIAEILLLVLFLVPYIDWLIGYLDSTLETYTYYNYGDYYLCVHCNKIFEGALKYLGIQTHLITQRIGYTIMDSFGLFIVPDYLAHLVLLVIFFIAILLLRPKKQKLSTEINRSRKGRRSKQTLTITFYED